MPTNNIFTWKDGHGWLVLSGGAVAGGPIRAAALERIAADGPLVCLSLGSEKDEALLNDLQELGAPAGYLVNILTEDDPTIREQISSASLVVLPVSTDAAQLRSALVGAAIEGLATAYQRGAVILTEGPAAPVLGAYIPTPDGFGWVEHALIVPGLMSAAESELVRRMISQQPDVIVIGPAVGSALVLGGDGSIQSWGKQQITITLGNAYTRS